jgi:hypothetical protein
MHEQIINLGWAWHGYCNCAMKGKIYRKGLYKLYHYYQNNLFWLGRKNSKIIQSTDEKLIETIKQY